MEPAHFTDAVAYIRRQVDIGRVTRIIILINRQYRLVVRIRLVVGMIGTLYIGFQFQSISVGHYKSPGVCCQSRIVFHHVQPVITRYMNQIVGFKLLKIPL